jgi:hypothetical protein
LERARLIAAARCRTGHETRKLAALRQSSGQLDLLNWTIRLNPGETKNDDGRVVIMTNTVHQLLTQCAAGKKPGDLVFTREDGKPVRDGAVAEFERKMLRTRVVAGMAQARRSGKHVGRPAGRKFHAAEIQKMKMLRSRGTSVRKLAAEFGTTQWMAAKLTEEGTRNTAAPAA